METEEIIILDEGLELSPDSPDTFCCSVVMLPYMG